MQAVGSTAFVYEAGLRWQVVSPTGSDFCRGTPLRRPIFTAVKHFYVSPNFTPEILSFHGKTRPGKSNRSVTRLADCFLGGATPIQTSPHDGVSVTQCGFLLGSGACPKVLSGWT